MYVLHDAIFKIGNNKVYKNLWVMGLFLPAGLFFDPPPSSPKVVGSIKNPVDAVAPPA